MNNQQKRAKTMEREINKRNLYIFTFRYSSSFISVSLWVRWAWAAHISFASPRQKQIQIVHTYYILFLRSKFISCKLMRFPSRKQSSSISFRRRQKLDNTVWIMRRSIEYTVQLNDRKRAREREPYHCWFIIVLWNAINKYTHTTRNNRLLDS